MSLKATTHYRRSRYLYPQPLGLFAFDWNFISGQYASATPGVSTSLSWPPAPGVFTRASKGWYFDQTGTLTEAAINAPRFDYNPTTLAPLGLLREGQSTNLVTYSQVSTGWVVAGGLTIADNNATAPDGTTTAALITKTVASGSAGSYYVGSMACTASTVYTVSFWCKLGTALAADMRYSMYNETGLAFFVSEVAYAQTATVGAWTRMTATVTTPVGCVSMRFYPWRYINAALNASIYAWGHQVEALAFASSYIKTAGATATRATDVTYLPAVAGMIGSGGVSMAAEFDFPAANVGGAFGYCGPGGFSDTIYGTTTGGSYYFTSILSSGGFTTGGAALGAVNTTHKAAFAATPARIDGAYDGVAMSGTTHNGIPAAQTISPAAGPWDTGNTSAPFMHIRRLRMWPRPLNAAELVQVTT